MVPPRFEGWKYLTHLQLFLSITVHELHNLQLQLQALSLAQLTWFIQVPTVSTDPHVEQLLETILALQQTADVRIRLIAPEGHAFYRRLKQERDQRPTPWLENVFQRYTYSNELRVCCIHGL